MEDRDERVLWRENSQRRIWMAYKATFQDGRLIRLWNLSDNCEIPLNTKTARMVERRHKKFLIAFPAKSAPDQANVKMRYACRHETARHTSA